MVWGVAPRSAVPSSSPIDQSRVTALRQQVPGHPLRAMWQRGRGAPRAPSQHHGPREGPQDGSGRQLRVLGSQALGDVEQLVVDRHVDAAGQETLLRQLQVSMGAIASGRTKVVSIPSMGRTHPTDRPPGHGWGRHPADQKGWSAIRARHRDSHGLRLLTLERDPQLKHSVVIVRLDVVRVGATRQPHPALE
jgi:hypothetical protein